MQEKFKKGDYVKNPWSKREGTITGFERHGDGLYALLNGEESACSDAHIDYLERVMLSPAQIIEKIKSLSGRIQGIYKRILENPDADYNRFAFEIAQQASTGELSHKKLINSVGHEIIYLSLQLYPNITLEDTYKPIATNA